MYYCLSLELYCVVHVEVLSLVDYMTRESKAREGWLITSLKFFMHVPDFSIILHITRDGAFCELF